MLKVEQIGFVVPLQTHPDLCYNTVTPQDNHGDARCGWTGGLFTLGGIGIVVW
ncbi:hypothetical protein LTS18_007569, partial [Coniosporium uncinatum]